jgi:hypothetical protein
MSGYSSRAEVVEVVKATIRAGVAPDLPADPGAYNVAGIVRENFYRWSGGWGGAAHSAEEFTASMRRNLRRKRVTR